MSNVCWGRRMAVVHREILIARSPEDVWQAIGDPAALSGWFPGIVTSEGSGTSRVITTASGPTKPEEIVTSDPARPLFQYRLMAPPGTDHLGTIEGTDAGHGASPVHYHNRCE